MKPVVIVDLGVEGGGATIYGRQNGEGNWLFWQSGCAMSGECDDWQAWEMEITPDVFASLPQSWWRMYPTEVHPDFRSRLADELKRALSQDAPLRATLARRWSAVLTETE